MKKVVVGLLSLIFITTGLFFTIFVIETTAVSRDDTKVKFEVAKGETYLLLSSRLKEENLIKNEFFYKIYIKIYNPKVVEAGVYELSESMSVNEIVKTFMDGNNYNEEVIRVTIPEGKHLEQVAEIISSKTNHSKEDLISIWNSEVFIDDVISNYWFISNEVKNENIRYALEGYFYPDTYELLNKDVTPESIAYKLLDKMSSVLEPYKEDIENSEYTIHEILTLASIIEHEAILDDDRKVISSVFHNRLESNMKLQSCATIGYAIDDWKLTYNNEDLNTDSPYNTYYYAGLPIGPGNMPSVKSIEAAINPEETDYLYFLANVCDETDKKTYFSSTYEEHLTKKNMYLTCIN